MLGSEKVMLVRMMGNGSYRKKKKLEGVWWYGYTREILKRRNEEKVGQKRAAKKDAPN